MGAGIVKILVSPQHPPFRVLEKMIRVPSGDHDGHMTPVISRRQNGIGKLYEK